MAEWNPTFPADIKARLQRRTLSSSLVSRLQASFARAALHDKQA